MFGSRSDFEDIDKGRFGWNEQVVGQSFDSGNFGLGGGFFSEAPNSSSSSNFNFLSNTQFNSGGAGGSSSWNKQSLMPLKISMIRRAWIDDASNSQIRIFDRQLDLFKIVGIVRNVTTSESRMSFLIDDSSGLITCDLMLASDSSPWKENYLNKLERENVYVKIFGGVNLLGKKEPHVRINSIKIIENFDDLIFHDLDVMFFILRCKYPNDTIKVKGGSNSVNTNVISKSSISRVLQNSTTSEESALLNSNNFNDTPSISMDRLISAVHSVLNDCSSSSNVQSSLHIMQIRKLVQDKLHTNYITESALREALNYLEGEAIVCQTVDKDTYASTGA